MRTKCDFFIDGVFAVSVDDSSKLDDIYKRLMPSDDYRQLMSSSGGYSGYRVFFSENEMRAHTVFWKTNSGFTDKDGNVLYAGDKVVDENGNYGYVEKCSEGFGFMTGKSRNEYYSIRSGIFNNRLTVQTAKTLKKVEDRKVIYR